MPREKLCEIDRIVLEIEDKFNITINYKKIPEHTFNETGTKFTVPHEFYPTMSVSDMHMLEKILEQIKDLSGIYINEIFKTQSPKFYDGTIKSARKASNKMTEILFTYYMNKPAQYSTRSSYNSPDIIRQNTPKPVWKKVKVSFCDAQFAALHDNFDKYLPHVLTSIAYEIYTSLPDEINKKYLSLITSKEKGYFVDHAVFMKDASAYQLSKLRCTELNWNSQKMKFFDDFFSKDK